MKTCDKCKKLFSDDMNYCPYCGTKVVDDKDELRKAMADLMEEDVVEKKVVSRVKKQRKINEEKENKVLNRILIILIAILTTVMFVFGATYMIKQMSSKPKDPVVDIADESKEPEKQPEKTPEQPVKQPEKEEQPENKPSGSIAFENDPDAKIFVKELLVSEEDGQIRLDIKVDSKVKGELFLKDHASLNVGPIKLSEGENSFYFLVSGQSDYVLYVTSGDESFSSEISKDKILEALKSER